MYLKTIITTTCNNLCTYMHVGEEGADGFITKAQGEALCKELKGYKYVECSARKGENLKQVCCYINCM